NWIATVNGAQTPIARVNGTFRGVRVPPGPFRVEMSYEPHTLRVAVAVSVFATLAVLGLIVIPLGWPSVYGARLLRGRDPIGSPRRKTVASGERNGGSASFMSR